MARYLQNSEINPKLYKKNRGCIQAQIKAYRSKTIYAYRHIDIYIWDSMWGNCIPVYSYLQKPLILFPLTKSFSFTTKYYESLNNFFCLSYPFRKPKYERIFVKFKAFSPPQHNQIIHSSNQSLDPNNTYKKKRNSFFNFST